MKSIEISDEVYATLQRLAVEARTTPEAILASLLAPSVALSEPASPLAAFVVGDEFRTLPSVDEKYLALLAWIATHQAAEFGEFIHSQSIADRFLRMRSAEVLQACRHHHARQIDGTQYWAVLNLDAATKRRFLARLLEFVGCREAVIDFVCGVSGLRPPTRLGRFAARVA